MVPLLLNVFVADGVQEEEWGHQSVISVRFWEHAGLQS